jgi:hypothetical protein
LDDDDDDDDDDREGEGGRDNRRGDPVTILAAVPGFASLTFSLFRVAEVRGPPISATRASIRR